MSKPIRIQKLLSQKGLFSRRQVEDFIRQKRLTLNGQLVRLGDRMLATDRLELNGQPVDISTNPQPVLLLFHKPSGLETTLALVPGGQSLADVDFGVGRVFPIGRLDKESRGLLLLTNDGDLSQKLLHPKFAKEKEYHVTLDKPVSEDFCRQMSAGVMINNKKTAPCRCEKINPKQIKLVLQEGRNRQIRKMAGALDYTVRDLLRVRFGEFELDDIEAGKWETLSEAKFQQLKEKL